MKCPQCNYKMRQDVCPYCNIEKKDVKQASNQKAKIYMQSHKKDKVVFTKEKPNDVNKANMLWFTIFLGFVGAGNFYVGRKKRGYFMLISFVVGMTLTYFKVTYMDIWLLENMANIASIFTIIAIFMWFSDIINVIFNRYRYPVVLPSDS